MSRRAVPVGLAAQCKVTGLAPGVGDDLSVAVRRTRRGIGTAFAGWHRATVSMSGGPAPAPAIADPDRGPDVGVDPDAGVGASRVAVPG